MGKNLLTNKKYDFIKWLIQVVSPALVVLIGAFGVMFEYDVTLIIGCIGAITVFLSSILGISNKNYTPEEEDTDA